MSEGLENAGGTSGARNYLERVVADSLPAETWAWFLERVDAIRAATKALAVGRPAPKDKKRRAAELEALRATIAIVSRERETEVRSDLMRQLRLRERVLAVDMIQIKPGATAELKESVAGDVLAAIAIAKGVRMSDLKPGRDPEIYPASGDVRLLLAAFAVIGITDQRNTTFKRAIRLIREAQNPPAGKGRN